MEGKGGCFLVIIVYLSFDGHERGSPVYTAWAKGCVVGCLSGCLNGFLGPLLFSRVL